MLRTRFNIPAGSVSHLASREFRATLKEALLLALASKQIPEILNEHSEWYDKQIIRQGSHTARLRIYEYETLISRVAPYKIRERSIIVSYGIHLRQMVMDEYVPLAMRMPHHEKSVSDIVHANGGEVKADDVVPHLEPAKAKSVTTRPSAAVEHASVEAKHEPQMRPKPTSEAKDKATNNMDKGHQASFANEEELGEEDIELAEGGDELSELRSMAQGLF